MIIVPVGQIIKLRDTDICVTDATQRHQLTVRANGLVQPLEIHRRY
jgi:hypothetical protein